MSVRGFLRQLLKDRPRRDQPQQQGDRLAREIRDTSGQWVGATTFRHLENRNRSNDPEPSS